MTHQEWLTPQHESSTGKLLNRVAFMNHEDKGHSALKHYAVLKALMFYFYFLHAPLSLNSVGIQLNV